MTGDDCAAMAAIWQDEMGLDHVAPADDYFALGGDSMTAVRIMIRVREEFGVELPISVLLEKPTLREFAQHVAALSDAGAAGAPPPDHGADIEEGLV